MGYGCIPPGPDGSPGKCLAPKPWMCRICPGGRRWPLFFLYEAAP